MPTRDRIIGWPTERERDSIPFKDLVTQLAEFVTFFS